MPNTTRKPARVGVRDWDAKVALLKSLYGVCHNRALVEAVADIWTSDKDELESIVRKLYDAFRRWGTSKPTGGQSQRFWRQVIEDKNADAGMEVLLSGSIVDFAAAFATDSGIQNAVADLLFDFRDKFDPVVVDQLRNAYGIATHTEQRPEDQFDFRGYGSLRFQGPQTGVSKGHIQSTQFYNMPESAMAWSDMVDSQNYQTYLACLWSLKTLMKSVEWARAIEQGNYDGAVALGGGASPEKDWVVVQSMAAALEDQKKSLHYVVNDISPYMLLLSARVLNRRREKSAERDRFNFAYHWFDFLDFDDEFVRPGQGSIVWSILGGTIGNLSESRFFESLNDFSRNNDLLIMSIDTLDGISKKDFQNRMARQYRSDELDRLLLSSLQGWSDAIGTQSLSVDATTQSYAASAPMNLSDVPGSSTAVFSVKTPKRKLRSTVLAHSTRYASRDLIKFAATYGWHFETSAEAPNGSTFRQFLFRRSDS